MSSTKDHWCAVPAAQLQWHQDQPQSTQFSDIYYSSDSGLDESRYVFLQGNDLPARWSGQSTYSIFESGFGTGLNFLNTLQSWLKDARASDYLHYTAVEKFPLRKDDLSRALGAWPQLHLQSEPLLAQYPPLIPGQHRLLLEDGRVRLDLWFCDLHECLESLQQDPGVGIDSWYLDGFAPARNPDMWTQSLYDSMAALSRPGAGFSTFTAAGHVRRGLEQAGFAVDKVQGYGRKREMLKGALNAPPRQRQHTSLQWHRPANHIPLDSDIVIIGAGLAGAHTAAALASRGRRVRVLDAGSAAGAASGNTQGVLYTRMSHRPSALNDFSLHSFSYALRHYRTMFSQGLLRQGQHGEFCGVLQLQNIPDSGSLLHQTVDSLPELCRYLDAEQAAVESGLADCPEGLYFPWAGWLQPAAVCKALLANPLIELKENCGELYLQQHDDCWRIIDTDKQSIAEAETVVLAAGSNSNQLAPDSEWIPLQSIRGQVSHLPSQGSLVALKTVICHDGYLPPAHNEEHCIGATFDLKDPDPQLRADSHQFNLDKLKQALGIELADVDLSDMGGRVGFRCASPDYLPMAGPVVMRDSLLEHFGFLRKNARQLSSARADHHPGLYLSTAHGSRGLTSTPLCAELLASQICDETAPLPVNLQQALSPSRFLIRDLIRNRI